MTLSSHYQTPTFRAVDDDATNINQPLSSALEAQLASSHEWLHRRAAGAVALHHVPGGNTLAGYNNTFHVAATWASVFIAPFLVTRGLSQIKVTFLGTVEAYNVSTRLELLGFGAADVVWVIGSGSNNVVRQAILTLDQPAEVEFETDLILWAKTQLTTSFSTSPEPAVLDAGKLEVDPAALSTAPNATLIAVSTRWSGSGYPATVIYESLFRNPAATRYDTSGPVGAAILSERIGGAPLVAEVECARLTSRAIFLETLSL